MYIVGEALQNFTSAHATSKQKPQTHISLEKSKYGIFWSLHTILLAPDTDLIYVHWRVVHITVSWF